MPTNVFFLSNHILPSYLRFPFISEIFMSSPSVGSGGLGDVSACLSDPLALFNSTLRLAADTTGD